MSFTGVGCRLQTCRWLAPQWFDSTFRATFSPLFFFSPLTAALGYSSKPSILFWHHKAHYFREQNLVNTILPNHFPFHLLKVQAGHKAKLNYEYNNLSIHTLCSVTESACTCIQTVEPQTRRLLSLTTMRVCILNRPKITYKLTTDLFLLSLPVLLLASLPTASVPVLVMVAAV